MSLWTRVGTVSPPFNRKCPCAAFGRNLSSMGCGPLDHPLCRIYFWRAVDRSPFCYQVYDRYRADMFGHRRLLDKRPAEFKRNRVTAAIAEMKNRIRVHE
jgi:hypothetical protein